MKSRGALFIAGLAMFASMRGAEAPIEFSGVLTNDGRTQLALTNKATGTTTWVEPGTTFLGYTIARYDAEHDAIFLRKNGEETRLALTAPKPVTNEATTIPTAPSAAAAPSPGSPAPNATQIADAVRAHLRTLAAAARRYQAEHGASTVTYADLVGPGKPIAELPSVAGESYATFAFAPGATSASVTLANGTPISISLSPAAAPDASTRGALVAGEPPPFGASTATAPKPNSTSTAATTPSTNPPLPTGEPPPATASPANTAPLADSSGYPASDPNLAPTGRAPTAATYTTGVGESWESISARTGVPAPKLKELNSPISSGSSLPQGQTIRLR